MTLKKKCTELLKTAVEGTQNTLSAISPEKIAENIDSVRNKTCEKLGSLKEKLEAELAKYDTETNGDVKDNSTNQTNSETQSPVDEIKDPDVKVDEPLNAEEKVKNETETVVNETQDKQEEEKKD